MWEKAGFLTEQQQQQQQHSSSSNFASQENGKEKLRQ